MRTMAMSDARATSCAPLRVGDPTPGPAEAGRGTCAHVDGVGIHVSGRPSSLASAANALILRVEVMIHILTPPGDVLVCLKFPGCRIGPVPLSYACKKPKKKPKWAQVSHSGLGLAPPNLDFLPATNKHCTNTFQ
jgi:hypothetical protein